MKHPRLLSLRPPKQIGGSIQDEMVRLALQCLHMQQLLNIQQLEFSSRVEEERNTLFRTVPVFKVCLDISHTVPLNGIPLIRIVWLGTSESESILRSNANAYRTPQLPTPNQ
jgi:hypothetical protein